MIYKGWKRKYRKAKRKMLYLIEAGLDFTDQRRARGNIYQFAKALLKESHPAVYMFFADYFKDYGNKPRLQRMSDQGLVAAFV